MTAVYVRLIKAGKMALDDVPARWREAVAARLEEEQDEGEGA